MITTNKFFLKLNKFLSAFGLASLLFILISIPLIRYAKIILVREVPMNKADWIIVLGGESSPRVFGAAELYHKGVAPNIFVTGSGDCHLIVQRLELAGVPQKHVQTECDSRSTQENSLFTKQKLSALNIKKAILVTNWYHSYRALSVFKKNWPSVNWGVHIVYPGDSLHKGYALYDVGYIYGEYLKIIYYWIKW